MSPEGKEMRRSTKWPKVYSTKYKVATWKPNCAVLGRRYVERIELAELRVTGWKAKNNGYSMAESRTRARLVTTAAMVFDQFSDRRDFLSLLGMRKRRSSRKIKMPDDR